MKKTNLSKRLLAMLLAIIIIAGTFAIAVSAAPNHLVGSNSMRNEYIDLTVNSRGRFTIGTVEGNPDNPNDNNQKMLFGWPGGGTSYTTIVIDETEYKYGDNGFTSAPTFNVDEGTNISVAKYGDIEVKQILKLVNNTSTNRFDVVEISYEVKNTGSVNHEVGVRIMMDTMLGNNDRAPFRVPNAGNITTQTEFTGDNIPQFWQAFDSLENQRVVAQGSFYRSPENKPDRVQFTNWGRVSDDAWDCPVNAGSSNGDSAVTITWDKETLYANKTIKCTTHYGLSELLTDARPPLLLSVYGDSTIAIVDGKYTPNPIKAIAYISNISGADAHNVQLTINTSSHLLLEGDTHSRTFNIGDVPNRREVTHSVDVKVEGVREWNYEYIEFKLSGDNFEEKVLKKFIKVPPIGRDNTIIFGEDNFKFLNSYDDFCKKSEKAFVKYWTSDEYFNLVTKDMDNVVTNKVAELRDSNWGGSCYGMSCMVSMFKDKRMSPSYFEKRASNVHELKAPLKDKAFRDAINAHQLTHMLPDIRNDILAVNGNRDDESQLLNQIINEAGKVKYGGMPVVIVYQAKYDKADGTEEGFGHAVLAYQVEHFDHACATFNGQEYTYRVFICDPNYHDFKKLFISEDKQHWYYEGLHGEHQNDNLHGVNINGVISDSFKIGIIDTQRMKNYAREKHYDKNFIDMYNPNCAVYTAEGTNVALKHSIAIESPFEEYVLPDSESYTIKPKDGESKTVEASIVAKTTSVDIKATKVEDVSLDKNGNVAFNGIHSNCKLGLTLNETSMPWYTVEISGDDIKNYEMKPDSEGIVISGDNLTNTTVIANNRDEKVTVKIDTNEKSVKLDDTAEGKLGVYVDNDKDGSYETKIAESKPYDENEARLQNFLQKLLKVVKFVLKALFELLELVYNEITLIK